MRAELLGQLDREGARAPPGAVDQDPVAGRGAGGALQGDRTGLRERRRLGEGQPGRLEGERRLGGDRVLGEAALQCQVVAVHLVTDREAGDAVADGVDPPGDVRARGSGSPGRRSPPSRAYSGDPSSVSQSLRFSDVAATLTRT